MKTVAVIGEGTLADTVCKHLAGIHVVRRPDFNEALPPAGLVLVLGGNASVHQEAEGILQPLGIPWLCCYVYQGEGMVGPLIRPGQPGCSQCADIRRSRAGRDREEMDDELMSLVFPDLSPPPLEELSPSGLRHLAYILAAEVAKVLRGEEAHAEGSIYFVNLSTLRTTIHYVLPESNCPVCSQLPDDSMEAAKITLRPCMKLSRDHYRSRSIRDLQKVLRRDYWDSRTGLLNDKQLDLLSVFASSVANLPTSMFNEVTGGHSHCYADSELAAILEGLERYCGFAPRGKRTVVYDSYSNLKNTAMDLSRIGFHSQEQIERPGFLLVPFDPSAEMPWVWGYSFLQERPILVPERLGYYSFGYEGGFVYETSNGCAIGGSLEEAILYGLLEVVERDSFLMTWYARLTVPRLDYRSSEDKELVLMIERVRAVTGYEVQLYNTTMEHGIPRIWAVAKGGADQKLNLVCAAGAHLDPIRAAKSAVHELDVTITRMEGRWEARQMEAEAMFHDSSLVQDMEDHALLYSLPQSEERLGFLLNEQRPLRTFQEQFVPVLKHDDLTDDLKQVLQVFRNLNLEVIVIDQSSSETLRNGLYCVKVLIPGMIPMTFGHQFTRLIGLDRVLEVPMELGYTNRRLSPEELNPYPHPFP
ncbi:ribosomal protein S12 methylthiotransferase accessory factor [Paenibacillus cellulosilyticus]|uniref:Ribosomal protein S12 methylthiotransferase accessory factor n=1 Tax=Paenibacillus cellulosilyticus TaxID=375489 RepID=A0A2V2YS38_9BACL|nr:TOMM precursor leader peptide-binding protein [Paenibacillus cellulosilyticus]PWW00964.1 ribosomal protein S12 methylthiotransferase accessory factor [Paenibacillus cellulosilyticus]QKS47609.1 TOMM precursor leader peptide-binding protein [Paenibacillus cellulosilyticus]